MNQVTRETRTVEHIDDREEVARTREPQPEPGTVAARVVYIITGIIVSLLAFRVLLSLLGANRDNAFADLIYTLSQPFAAPFFGLFSYDPQYGVARLELETLFAMLIYMLIGGLIARLLTVRQRDPAV